MTREDYHSALKSCMQNDYDLNKGKFWEVDASARQHTGPDPQTKNITKSLELVDSFCILNLKLRTIDG